MFTPSTSPATWHAGLFTGKTSNTKVRFLDPEKEGRHYHVPKCSYLYATTQRKFVEDLNALPHTTVITSDVELYCAVEPAR
jgi:hypothetical protein